MTATTLKPQAGIVTPTDTQTLTNKTLTSPVINTPTGDVATITGTQTLTNKTLTSPVINTPTGDVATLTGTQTLTNKRVDIMKTPNANVAMFQIDSTASANYSLAVNGTWQPFVTNAFSGLFVVNEHTNGVTALFLQGGGVLSLVGQTTGGVTSTKDTASKLNVYLDAGYIVTIQNKLAGAAAIQVFSIRTRTFA